MPTYAYRVTIEIPDVPDGIVDGPDGVTEEQIREYVVNDLAKEHVGKTVRVVQWSLTPPVRGA
jgi:hypothetical protein